MNGIALVVLLGMAAAASAEGTKLKWVPYRPSMPEARTAAKPAQGATKSAGMVRHTSGKMPTHLAQQGGGDPMQNPFGDSSPTFQQPPRGNAAVEQPAEPKTNDQEQSTGADPAYTPSGPNELDAGLGDPLPSMDNDLGQAGPDLEYECPSSKSLKPISEISYDIRPEAGELPKECPVTRDKHYSRDFAMTTFTWKASGLCHKPLYFEDVQLERYGHSWGPYLQPLVSGGHFFATLPILPYKMGMYPPGECMYTLGYYRPGNCAPYMLDPIPISVRGGLAEAGAVLGAVYLIP